MFRVNNHLDRINMIIDRMSLMIDSNRLIELTLPNYSKPNYKIFSNDSKTKFKVLKI